MSLIVGPVKILQKSSFSPYKQVSVHAANRGGSFKFKVSKNSARFNR